MKTLDQGKDKIQKICEALRIETLEPAKREAEELLDSTRKKADDIIADAQIQAKNIIDKAKERIKQEESVFESALQQASQQCLEALRQEIEKGLFNDALGEELAKEMSDPKTIAKLINVVVAAIDRDGTSEDLAVIIPQKISADEINTHLLKEIYNRLEKNSIAVGPLSGGIQVKLIKEQLTLDISDKAIKDFLMHYLRKDFRQRIFAGLTGT
jgi:V/A-type H+-transporting ATPase subunit E